MLKKAKVWKVTSEMHAEYLWRLGDLTLLGQEYNRSATNKDFDHKKKVYSESENPMKKLLKYEKWTKKDIENRQKSFVDVALKIWKK